MISRLLHKQWILLLTVLTVLSAPSFAQNYLGYSKEYIIDAMNFERPEMMGPFVFDDNDSNYICFVSQNKQRIVLYIFEKMEVSLQDGEISRVEICTKYMSKTMCPDYTRCPQLDMVIRTLEGNFTNAGHHIWIDYSGSIPQEWVLVAEDHYFEVHVTEKKPK